MVKIDRIASSHDSKPHSDVPPRANLAVGTFGGNIATWLESNRGDLIERARCAPLCNPGTPA